MTFTPVYIDATYRVYCTGWDYESYVSVNGGEASYTNEFEGKLGDTFELSTSTIPDGECTVFMFSLKQVMAEQIRYGSMT